MQNRFKIFSLVFLLAISISRYYFEQVTPVSRLSLLYTLITVVVSLLVFFKAKETNSGLRNNYLKISLLFLTGFVIVHFVEYLKYVIGVHDSLFYSHMYNLQYVNGAAILSLCCLIAFEIGNLSINRGFKSSKSIYNNYNRKRQLLLEFLMLVFLIVFYKSAGTEYFNGGYGEMTNSGSFSLVASLSQVFFQGAMLATTINVMYARKCESLKSYISFYSPIYYLTLFIYLILVLSSGDRGPLIHCVLCYGIPFFLITNKKLKLPLLVIAIIIAALSLSLLGMIRAIDGELSIDKVLSAQTLMKDIGEDEGVFFSATSDLSNVVRSYHVIYDMTYDSTPIFGLGFINQVLGFIPGLRFLLYPMLGVNEMFLNTNMISTILLDMDHGMGTTCVADTYYNVGFIGCIIIFLLFGMFVKLMDYSASSNVCQLSPILISLIIGYFCFSIYIGRGLFSSPINFSMWGWIIYRCSRVVF